AAPARTAANASTPVAPVGTKGGARGVSPVGPVAIQATIAGKAGSAQLTVNSSPIVVGWSSAAAVTPVSVTTCLAQSVVWRNTDANVVHSATGSSGPPTTGAIQPGASSVAEASPSTGSYPSHCDSY